MAEKENNRIKPLSELNLMNRFLFSEAMDDPDNVITVLEIILGKKIDIAQKPQTEKEERKGALSKIARLDLFAVDTDGTNYDVESQIENTNNLRRRSRYYHGMIDSHLIKVGEIDYNKLNDTYVIMICSFDLFGYDRYMYTFRMKCDEESDLPLDDGAVRIFLNTKGKNADEVSPELIELLRYMEDTTKETAEGCKNPQIMKMHQRVEKIRSSEEVNTKYMKEWEEKKIAEEKARAEGKAEGITEGMAVLILNTLETFGKVPETLRDRIMAETDRGVLTKWNFVAARSGSVEEFEKAMSNN